MDETATPSKEAADLIAVAGGGSSGVCYECGLCDTVCPWNLVKEFPPRRLVREAQFGLTELGADAIWQCSACGLCVDRCPRGVGIADVFVAARRIATEHNMVPRGIGVAGGSLAGEGNPWGGQRGARRAWGKGTSVGEFREDMELLFFSCCTQCYEARTRRSAVATAGILDRSGVDFGVIGSTEVCCGESIRKAGDEKLFRRLAKDNIKTFVENGVKRVLVSSPHCYEAFKKDYAEFMVNFEVVHVSEYLLELIEDGRLELTKEYRRRVTYHDPCYLGRHNGLYDQPRELLERIPGLELVEMPDAAENGLCCGGGGGRIWMDTPKGERLSDLRLEQAQATGASVLATFCPYCVLNFEDSRLGLNADSTIDIMDVTEIIHEVI